MTHQDFVDKHYADLVSRVTSVMPIADLLLGKKMLIQENYSKIKAANTPQEKMRTLLSVVKSGGPKVKSYFYEVLKLNEPYLVQDLQGSSAQNSSGELESQAAAQDNTPEEVLTRWNQSSKKHKSAIDELRTDPSKIKVGNFYFSRNNLIGTGSNRVLVYLGLKEDGTEVAIKRILKCGNNTIFENELKHLQDLNLESRNIVRYVDFAEDCDFYYIALQLCECDLETYIKDFHEQLNKDTALKKIVKDVLLGLEYLHHAGVIHRDIKPQNVLMDSGNNARLADFGLSRKQEEGSTVHTVRAGTRGWEAVETLVPSGDTKYKSSSDVQVAGMLVYYILSGGKHPFDVNNLKDIETNIKEGTYSLDGVCDIVARDLIERMINIDPAQRPTIEEALDKHPYFYDDDRKNQVIKALGDRDEVQHYLDIEKLHNLYRNNKVDSTAIQTADKAFYESYIQDDDKRKETFDKVGSDFANLCNLCDTAKKYSDNFPAWNQDLQEMGIEIYEKLPKDILGLLRFLRNILVHPKKEIDEKDMLNHLPDFFISLYGLAKDLSWNFPKS